MDNEGISCIAVGDMLKKRLAEYTDALAGGADEATLARMEGDIDKIEAVHERCVEMGNVTDVDSSSIVVDEAEGEGDTDDFINGEPFDSEETLSMEEEDEN